MTRVLALVSIAILFAPPSYSQPAASFEVASVRLHNPQDSGQMGTGGGPGTRDPERYFGRGMPLRIFLCIAFDIGDCQQQISGPGWIDSEKYDVSANVPPGATKKQFQIMLQNLLAERFQLVFRHETRILPIYELVIAKGGPKLKESTDIQNGDPPPSGPTSKATEVGADGFPQLPPVGPAFRVNYGPGSVVHWAAQQQSISTLADNVEAFLLGSAVGAGNPTIGRQVIDRTGLTGKYDFRLIWDMPNRFNSDDILAAPPMEDALEKQLGLKLMDSKAPFDYVIVERGEKVPKEN